MKKCPEESFKKEKDLDLYRDSLPRKVAVLSLRVVNLGPRQIPLIPFRLSDPRSLLNWVHHHRALPSKVVWYSKGVSAIISFIRGLVICRKVYVFGVDKLGMLRNTAQCWAVLGKYVSHQRSLVLQFRVLEGQQCDHQGHQDWWQAVVLGLKESNNRKRPKFVFLQWLRMKHKPIPILW